MKFLATLADPVTRRYGEKLLSKIKSSVPSLAPSRRDAPRKNGARGAAGRRRGAAAGHSEPPRGARPRTSQERFREHGRYYFTFLAVPGVEPTNNAMEQRMRFVAIDRKITQGTRGERGRRWCERMWTVLATCVQQGRSAFTFLHQSLLAYFTKQPSPSLLPLPP